MRQSVRLPPSQGKPYFWRPACAWRRPYTRRGALLGRLCQRRRRFVLTLGGLGRRRRRHFLLGRSPESTDAVSERAGDRDRGVRCGGPHVIGREERGRGREDRGGGLDGRMDGAVEVAHRSLGRQSAAHARLNDNAGSYGRGRGRSFGERRRMGRERRRNYTWGMATACKRATATTQ